MRKRIISVYIVVILACGICGCTRTSENTLDAETESVELEDTEAEDEETADAAEQEEQTETAQRKWQVYIQPDMPDPFVEVLKQYEEFLNTDIQILNGDAWWDEFCAVNGGRGYLCDELCLSLKSLLNDSAEESDIEAFRYSLKDLTGDGFPELIMGKYLDLYDETYLYVVYYYSEAEGIKMEWASRYFSMILYEDGIIEYISGGVNYTMSYYQFQEETESWERADCIIVEWDPQSDSKNYYRGVNLADFSDPDNEPMTEEEYQEIIERYTPEPVELEWIPMFCGEASEQKIPCIPISQEDFTSGKRIEVIPAQKADIPKREDEGGRRITVEEMQYFSEFVQKDHNYGFLLSAYDTPADVNLDEVCFNGVGASAEGGISEEEREAYKKTVPWGEIETDFFRVTTAQLNDFLLEKTGLSYEQMNDTLNWTYLPEYDAYYSDHGDTNYRIFDCKGGYTVDEKFFVLRMEPGSYGPSEVNCFSGYHQMSYELVLEKCGDTYQFRSNRLILEEGLIEDQSFDVNLNPIGEVTFVSFEPDVEKEPFADVTFSIIKDGWEIEQLWGVSGYGKNIREADIFNGIEAVAFADYDEDGITDIIMILEYAPVSGTNAGETYSEIRIYKGEYKEYSYGDHYFQRYQEDLSKSITVEFSEPTIRGVLDYLAAINSK